MQGMYDKVKTSVKSVSREIKSFRVKVSPHLFSLVMNKFTKSLHSEVPRCIVFTDDVVLVNKKTNALECRLKCLWEVLEKNRLKISRTKQKKFLKIKFKKNWSGSNIRLRGQLINDP